MHSDLTPVPRGTSPSQPAIIALCMVITVIEGYNLIVFGSVVPLLLDDAGLGVAPSQIGAIGGLVYIGAVIGALLAPVVGERIGRKRVLLGTVALFAVGAALTAAATSGEMLGAARFVAGLGVGGALTTAMTVARNCAPPRRAALVVTVTMAGIPLGGVVAALLAVPVLPAVGWRPMFLVGAGLALLILVAVAGADVRDEPADAGTDLDWTPREKLLGVFTGRGLVVAAIVAVCAIANMVAWQGLNVWAAEAMVQTGFSLRGALLLTFVLTGAAVIGSFLTAWAADRHGPARIGIVSGSSTVLGLVGMLLGPSDAPYVVLCVALMGIGGHSTMNLVHTATSNIFPVQARATAMGWSNSTSFVGAFLGPVLGGTAIAAGGPDRLFGTYGVAAAVCVTAVAALAIAERSTRHAAFRTPVSRGEVTGTLG